MEKWAGHSIPECETAAFCVSFRGTNGLGLVRIPWVPREKAGSFSQISLLVSAHEPVSLYSISEATPVFR